MICGARGVAIECQSSWGEIEYASMGFLRQRRKRCLGKDAWSAGRPPLAPLIED
jgi:hypothetical protein